MGIQFDDAVIIQHGKNSGDPTMVTVNCPDKAGLGCDLSRVVLEFGLYTTRGDFSTDGKWCYVVLWVAARPSSLTIDWDSLKTRLLSMCPSPMISFYFNQNAPSPPVLYILKIFALDRTGLLNDVTKVLCELVLCIHRVKVMTTPDGKVLDLFFITDEMELLHTKDRRERTCEHLSLTLDEYCISCDLQLAGPEYDQQGFSSISPAVEEKLFNRETSSDTLSSEDKRIKKAIVTVDNLLSPGHTLLQIHCRDQKGIIYDILRTSKDCEIQVAHGRMSSCDKGFRNMDLLIRTTDGRKILDQDYLASFCSRLEEEMLHPLRVTIANRGPDTELLVANPVELSGRGRPRVFYDVTFALRTIGVCVFSADIGRHSTSERQWEVYRFRLDDRRDFPLDSSAARTAIIDRVKTTLMGW